MDKLLPENIRPVTWAVTEIAALNWAFVEFFNTNLLTDTLGLSGDILTGTFAAIGAAGAVGLYNTVAHYLED
jgi:uncharacterized membrane protein YuzA (DUF378 family)